MSSMGFVSALALVLCGLMASASLIVKKKTNATQWINKLIPHQGRIGVLVMLWSIIGLIHSLIIVKNVNDYNDLWLWWFLYLGSNIMGIMLGFLLGFNMINKFLAEKETQMSWAEQEEAPRQKAARSLYEKIVPIQIPLGLAGIGFGAWAIFESIFINPPAPDFMGIFLAGLLLVCSILASAEFIVAKLSTASRLVEPLRSMQNFIAPATFIWSLISLLYMIRIHGYVQAEWWYSGFFACLAGIILGFLLGYSTLSRFLLSGNDQLVEKGAALRGKIARIQIPLGIAGMVLAFWLLLATFIWAS